MRPHVALPHSQQPATGPYSVPTKSSIQCDRFMEDPFWHYPPTYMKFPTNILNMYFHVSHLCFVLCSSHCPWFDHPNLFWGYQRSEFVSAGYVSSIKQVLNTFTCYCYVLCYLKCGFVSILRWWGGAWTAFPHCIASKLQFFFIFFTTVQQKFLVFLSCNKVFWCCDVCRFAPSLDMDLALWRPPTQRPWDCLVLG